MNDRTEVDRMNREYEYEGQHGECPVTYPHDHVGPVRKSYGWVRTDGE